MLRAHAARSLRVFGKPARHVILGPADRTIVKSSLLRKLSQQRQRVYEPAPSTSDAGDVVRRKKIAPGGRPLIHPLGKPHRRACCSMTGCRRTCSAGTLLGPECVQEFRIESHLCAPISSSGHVRVLLRSAIPHHRFCSIRQERAVAERRWQQRSARRITPNDIARRRSETRCVLRFFGCPSSQVVARCCRLDRSRHAESTVASSSLRTNSWLGRPRESLWFIGLEEGDSLGCRSGSGAAPKTKPQ